MDKPHGGLDIDVLAAVHKERDIVLFKDDVKNTAVILLIAANDRNVLVAQPSLDNKPFYLPRDKLALVVKVCGAVHGDAFRLGFELFEPMAENVLLQLGDIFILIARSLRQLYRRLYVNKVALGDILKHVVCHLGDHE